MCNPLASCFCGNYLTIVPGARHLQYSRAHLDLAKGDIAMLLVADGFRVFDSGETSAWMANLSILNLPPELRHEPALMFNFFGFSGSPAGSLDPFLRVALAPFLKSFQNDSGTDFFSKVLCLTVLLYRPWANSSRLTWRR